jgi:hypothetical protein
MPKFKTYYSDQSGNDKHSSPHTITAPTQQLAVQALAREIPNVLAESIAVIEAGITYTFPNPNYRPTDLQAGRIDQGNRESHESENLMGQPRSPSTTGPLTFSSDAGRLDAILRAIQENTEETQKVAYWVRVIGLPVLISAFAAFLGVLLGGCR